MIKLEKLIDEMNWVVGYNDTIEEREQLKLLLENISTNPEDLSYDLPEIYRDINLHSILEMLLSSEVDLLEINRMLDIGYWWLVYDGDMFYLLDAS